MSEQTHAKQMDTTNTNSLEELTTRDREVLSLVMSGLGNREIAQQLNLQYQTVRNRISQMYKKLGVRNRTELLMWAVNNGYGRPEMIAPWLKGAED